MQGILVNIEGTDCSGKGTQTELLLNRLKEEGYKVCKLSFPMYDTPTGKIVGGPYLGKHSICDGYFKEGAANVDAKVASLYFAADRYYNSYKIREAIDDNDVVILDRYTDSNMAHQGGKIKDYNERIKMYKWLDTLEYGLLNLPKPDLTIFLYMPHKYAEILKKDRTEIDEHESSEDHLINAEKAYIEISNMYKYKTINCISNDSIRTIEDINNEVYGILNEYMNIKKKQH